MDEHFYLARAQAQCVSERVMHHLFGYGPSDEKVIQSLYAFEGEDPLTAADKEWINKEKELRDLIQQALLDCLPSSYGYDHD